MIKKHKNIWPYEILFVTLQRQTIKNKRIMNNEKDKTIDTIKQMIADGVLTQENAKKYFPQLEDSEDEKIRKKVVDVLKLNIKGAETQMQASRGVDRTFEVYACNKVIAWLEKKGEQKQIRQQCADFYNKEV